MKIVITENQLKYVLEQQSDELCIQDYVETVNSHLNGLVNLTDDEVYSAYEDPNEILNEVKDSKTRTIVQNIITNISRMTLDQKKSELKKLLGMVKGIQEQQTPYIEQTVEISGVQVPKVAVHSVVGLVIIVLLSKIINILGQKMDSIKPSRKSGSKYIVGCQGARSRAKAVRRRRRKENWKNFLRKIGVK
jgi:hypothetical protein